MAIKDLKKDIGMDSGLYKCFLAEDSKRITSPYFKVHIPSLMNGIERDKEDEVKPCVDNSKLLNADKADFTDINVTSTITAKNIAPYAFKYEGWIPDHKTETAESKTIEASTTEGVTEPGGPGPHTHGIKKALTLFDNTETKIEYTNTTEVDFQDINKVYIKRGHVLYGHFVKGGTSDEFVIIAIDNAVPYYDENEDSGENIKI